MLFTFSHRLTSFLARITAQWPFQNISFPLRTARLERTAVVPRHQLRVIYLFYFRTFLFVGGILPSTRHDIVFSNLFLFCISSAIVLFQLVLRLREWSILEENKFVCQMLTRYTLSLSAIILLPLTDKWAHLSAAYLQSLPVCVRVAAIIDSHPPYLHRYTPYILMLLSLLLLHCVLCFFSFPVHVFTFILIIYFDSMRAANARSPSTMCRCHWLEKMVVK